MRQKNIKLLVALMKGTRTQSETCGRLKGCFGLMVFPIEILVALILVKLKISDELCEGRGRKDSKCNTSGKEIVHEIFSSV